MTQGGLVGFDYFPERDAAMPGTGDEIPRISMAARADSA
jgi:hypothetical protein